MPATKVEDVTEQDGLGLLQGDEPMAELAVVPPALRRNPVLDNNIKDEDGSPLIILVSDTRLKRRSVRGPNAAFAGNLPLLTDQNLGHTSPEHSLKMDRRHADLDMLRCMIGRVYRPCWEVRL